MTAVNRLNTCIGRLGKIQPPAMRGAVGSAKAVGHQRSKLHNGWAIPRDLTDLFDWLCFSFLMAVDPNMGQLNFILYPIYWVANRYEDDERFETERLPLDIVEGVTIEDISGRFREDAFATHREHLGTDVVEEMERVQHALVLRYSDAPQTVTVQVVGQQSPEAERKLRTVFACLRIIRPMRERAQPIYGKVREDGSFDVTGFFVPPQHILEVPTVQKLFKLRDQDADALIALAPLFLETMEGAWWKFRMAVQFHELGHFQQDWKARYLLWCSAIESIYTSHSPQHKGSLVAKERIKWFLGDKTSIYAPGDLSTLLENPNIVIGDAVGDLYNARNYMAHGDRLPDKYFQDVVRYDFNGGVNKLDMLAEAASFIIRASLLKILRDGVRDHFRDASSAEAYFGSFQLTLKGLKKAKGPQKP